MRVLRVLILLLAMVALPACPEDSAEAGAAATTEAVYECPMHCVPEGATEEYTSSEPGTCPVCSMDLEMRE